MIPVPLVQLCCIKCYQAAESRAHPLPLCKPPSYWNRVWSLSVFSNPFLSKSRSASVNSDTNVWKSWFPGLWVGGSIRRDHHLVEEDYRAYESTFYRLSFSRWAQQPKVVIMYTYNCNNHLLLWSVNVTIHFVPLNTYYYPNTLTSLRFVLDLT